MKTLLLLLFIITLMSCEKQSRSGKITPTHIEKVVIVDMAPLKEYNEDNKLVYVYKVKRIEKGVSDYIRDSGLYEAGDTILVYSLQFR